MKCLCYKASELIMPHKMPFIYSHALNRPLSPISHCHDFYEIVYMFRGKVKHRVKGVSFEMKEGEVSFLRPMEEHVFLEQTEALELFSISVCAKEIEPFLAAYHVCQKISGTAMPIRFALSHNLQHALLTSFRQLDSKTPEQKKIQIRIILGETIHEYMNLLMGNSADWLDQVMMQMRQPECLKEGIPAFLRISNLSHAQLCRVIKQRTDQTPQQYIKELRLNYAYDLLISTRESCEEISFRVGYNSLSHFITSFKQQFGITPSSLRKKTDLLL